MHHRITGFVAVVAALGAVVGLLGCGEELSDVNRVQPHYVKKSDLLNSTWYYRQTLVDVPPEMPFLFDGIEGPLEKIRWEIREGYIAAHRVHPAVPGLEDDEVLEGAEYRGQPVATFRIQSHFDIFRSFSTTTGQQSNLLYEDTINRPWYEREYIRIDWTNSIRPGSLDLNLMGMSAWLPRAARWVRETHVEDPDHAQFTDDFIFVTTRTPFDASGICQAMGYGVYWAGGYNCGSVEAKLRLAFTKIDDEDAAQFEPRRYLDNKFYHDEEGERLKYTTMSVGPDKGTMVDMVCTPELLDSLYPEITERDCKQMSWDQAGRFGFFRNYRNHYDRRVGGGHDSTRDYFANHHQIWKRTKDENGATIPLNQRELRPIIYYLNPNFPDDLKHVAAKIAGNWNEAFMAAAVAATGRSQADIAAQLARDSSPNAVWLESDPNKGQALFQVRENTCSVAGVQQFLNQNPEFLSAATDATRGDRILPGNLERVCSSLTWHTQSLGPDTPDNKKFVWQQMGDPRFSYIWWVNETEYAGPLGYGPSSTDMENGRILSGNAHVYGAALDSYARAAADIVRAMNGDLLVEDLIKGQSYLQWMESGTTVADAPAQVTREMQQEISRRIGSAQMNNYRGFHDHSGHLDKAAMLRHMHDRMTNTAGDDPIEQALDAPFNAGMAKLKALKDDPEFRNLINTNEMLQLLGPLHGWRPGDDISDELRDLAFDATLDPGALKAAHDKRNKFLMDNNVYMADFMDDSIYGMALELKDLPAEEVYKVLREQIFESVMLHEIGHTVGMTHNFEASMDALNYQDEFWQIKSQNLTPEQEKAERLPEYRYTSIMEYGSRFNSDLKGLGKYDFAAIKFLYGHNIETFAPDVPVKGRLDLELDFMDYTGIPNLMGGVDNIKRRIDVPLEIAIEEKRQGLFDNARLYMENPNRNPADFWVDRAVPYFYCFDSFRGDLKCRVWDEGSNHTEAVQGAIQRFWNYYIFDNFRRDREPGQFINSFFGRMNRLDEYLTYPWQFYYFYDAYPVDTRDDLLQASTLGLNFINQVLGTPEPGNYCRLDPRFGASTEVYWPMPWYLDRDLQLDPAGCNAIYVPVGPGREQFLRFNDDHNFNIDYIGTFYQKANIIFNLFMPYTRFFRVTDRSDSRMFSIGYYRVFQEELLKIVRDLMMSTLTSGLRITNEDLNGNGQLDPGEDTNGDGVLAPQEWLFMDDDIFAQSWDPNKQTVTPQLLVDPALFGQGIRAESALPSGNTRILPQMPFNAAQNALVYATILATDQQDQQLDFVEYLVISEEGSGDDREYGPNKDQVRFTHPVTGQTYVATQTADNRSIAYELVSLTTRYTNGEWKVRQRQYEDALEQQAAGTISEDDMYAAEFYWEQADETLMSFVEMLDYLRDLRRAVDVGQ